MCMAWKPKEGSCPKAYTCCRIAEIDVHGIFGKEGDRPKNTLGTT